MKSHAVLRTLIMSDEVKSSVTLCSTLYCYPNTMLKIVVEINQKYYIFHYYKIQSQSFQHWMVLVWVILDFLGSIVMFEASLVATL